MCFFASIPLINLTIKKNNISIFFSRSTIDLCTFVRSGFPSFAPPHYIYIYVFFISIEMSCHNICYEKYHNVKPMSMSVLIMICSREVRLGRPSGCSYIIYIYTQTSMAPIGGASRSQREKLFQGWQLFPVCLCRHSFFFISKITRSNADLPGSVDKFP